MQKSDIVPLAEESLSLPETLAFIDMGVLKQAYAHPLNRLFFYLENWRSKQILRSVNKARLQEYLTKSRTKLLPFKVIQLAYWVKRLRPRIICEFGGGGSTVFFAELLDKYKIDGKVITFEQNKDYYERITSSIPESLRNKIEIHLCPTRYERISGYRCLSYELPFLPPVIDFAYIDGPSPQEGDPLTEKHPFFNGDIYNLHKKGITCAFAINDGRWFNLGFYKNVLRGIYRFQPTVRYRSFLMENRKVNPSAWSWRRQWHR